MLSLLLGEDGVRLENYSFAKRWPLFIAPSPSGLNFGVRRLVRGESRSMLSSMDHRMTDMERAFKLARSGEVSGLSEIVKALKGEGFRKSNRRSRAKATAG